MKLDSEILAQKNSPYLGKEIFVCNYLHFDFDLCSNGAYRHTVPTKCILVPKSESPSVKQLYGSENALVKLTKRVYDANLLCRFMNITNNYTLGVEVEIHLNRHLSLHVSIMQMNVWSITECNVELL